MRVTVLVLVGVVTETGDEPCLEVVVHEVVVVPVPVPGVVEELVDELAVVEEVGVVDDCGFGFEMPNCVEY
jgi:hypothetical protein